MMLPSDILARATSASLGLGLGRTAEGEASYLGGSVAELMLGRGDVPGFRGVQAKLRTAQTCAAVARIEVDLEQNRGGQLHKEVVELIVADDV